MFHNVVFAYPWVLYFLMLIPMIGIWYFFRGKKNRSTIIYSSFKLFPAQISSLRTKLIHLPIILRLIALALLIIALARPQNFSSGTNINTEGIDIAMVLDISGSMLAEDFKPNRLEAAKQVVDEFIQGRVSDRIGLVIFSRDAFTQCPLTIDYSVLRNLLKDIRSGMLEDGTAIGNAIANGVNRLKDSDAKSKVIILLTDGVNNAGEVDPLSAAEIARTFGIRIYAIGVGTRGEAPYPVQTPFGIRYQMMPVEIDETLLKQIAERTGGQYFRATNNRALKEIYEKIDRMEKSKIEVTSYRSAQELYFNWLAAAFIFLLVEAGLSRTLLRKLP
ncbi:vWA domain protein [Ignavibacterium album JCM 16511]|uniref:VWA domain protein n=1 Tax=Ignavibacterium album (strain DSM 19864 / JCM 16511 / NBRC 101810 / Mat9-16) TaxID=945713 RepID=I0ALA3_IGNAJ|nr:VWA domain-containing protein [Ignavibacterium album]AFH49760.1 vWA domain protein [Ignavibacterium album JCM 16511]